MLAKGCDTDGTRSREADFRRRHTAFLYYIVDRRVTAYAKASSSKTWAQYLRHQHLCCIAHKKQNVVQTITSNMIETGIWSESVHQDRFGSFNTLRPFTGAVPPTETSK